LSSPQLCHCTELSRLQQWKERKKKGNNQRKDEMKNQAKKDGKQGTIHTILQLNTVLNSLSSQLSAVTVLYDHNKRWDFISPLIHLPGKQV
jgi:hypothetical protein